MALGDISFDTSAIHSAGNLLRAVGTIEASDTATEFAIVPNSSIVSASVFNIDDVDATVRVVINSSDGTEGSNPGSLYVDSSSSDVDTFRFDVLFA